MPRAPAPELPPAGQRPADAPEAALRPVPAAAGREGDRGLARVGAPPTLPHPTPLCAGTPHGPDGALGWETEWSLPPAARVPRMHEVTA